MKHRIPIIALTLLLTSCLRAEPTTKPATQPAEVNPAAIGKLAKVDLGGFWKGEAPTFTKGGSAAHMYRNSPGCLARAGLEQKSPGKGCRRVNVAVFESHKQALAAVEARRANVAAVIVAGQRTKEHPNPWWFSKPAGALLIVVYDNMIVDVGDLRASSFKQVQREFWQVAEKARSTISPATRPASRPTTTTTATTTTTSAPTVDPVVMAILKRLEAAGDKYPNITAKIDYKVDMLQTGDTESRTGKVYYQGPGKKESAKFRIHFDTLRQGKGPKIKDVVDYAFDGAWLTVRKERIKQMSRYQVAPPGKKVNPLQLGKGPFPVPFGQKADTVIKHFRPTTRPIKKTDPKNTDYIKLTTRRRYRKEFSVVWLEMWIDRKTSLPVKIVAEDRSENQTTVLFKDIKTPKSFPKKTFTLPRPPAGWEYHVEKYKGQVKP